MDRSRAFRISRFLLVEARESPRQTYHEPHIPHIVFCTLYALNKSFTKKVIVGLKYEEIVDKFDDECYKPVVRLVSIFNALCFHVTIGKILKLVSKMLINIFVD